MERAFLEQLSSSGNMSPELRGYMNGAGGTSIRLVLWFMFMLFAGPIFSTVGGLLGAAIFRKPIPPPVTGVIDVTPPPSQS
jgi:hypothetical protein